MMRLGGMDLDLLTFGHVTKQLRLGSIYTDKQYALVTLQHSELGSLFAVFFALYALLLLYICKARFGDIASLYVCLSDLFEHMN